MADDTDQLDASVPMIQAATEPHLAGSIIPVDHEWPDDMRSRQLRKDAH